MFTALYLFFQVPGAQGILYALAGGSVLFLAACLLPRGNRSAGNGKLTLICLGIIGLSMEACWYLLYVSYFPGGSLAGEEPSLTAGIAFLAVFLLGGAWLVRLVNSAAHGGGGEMADSMKAREAMRPPKER